MNSYEVLASEILTLSNEGLLELFERAVKLNKKKENHVDLIRKEILKRMELKDE